MRIVGPGKRASALEAIAWAQAKAGNRADALSTAKSITNADDRAQVLVLIAWELARSGAVAGGLAAAKSIANVDDRVWVLKKLATTQAAINKSEGPSQFAPFSFDTANAIPNAYARSRLWTHKTIPIGRLM